MLSWVFILTTSFSINLEPLRCLKINSRDLFYVVILTGTGTTLNGQPRA